jgi:hypothetical protein
MHTSHPRFFAMIDCRASGSAPGSPGRHGACRHPPRCNEVTTSGSTTTCADVESREGGSRYRPTRRCRGYFKSEQILECAEANVTVTLPKP